MTWRLYDFSLDLGAATKPLAASIARHDKALAGQLRRAVASITLNIAEGGGRVGADRLHHYRIAYGSAKETRAVFHIAARLGYADTVSADQLADTVCALLWGSMT
jgi:four helix bundle protein